MTLMRIACSFVLVLTASPAVAGVLIVGGAQQTHASVPSAIAAAVDGDVILVRSSPIPTFDINGKAVSVIADSPTPVRFAGASVRNLAQGQIVVLSGLQHEPHFFYTPATPLILSSNAGSVRIQDCATEEVEVYDSADVAISRTTLTGVPGEFLPAGYTPSMQALHCDNSSVSLHDCTLKGGRGRDGGFIVGNNFPLTGENGAAAAQAWNGSVVFFSGCSLTGGDGGTGYSGGVPAPQCTTVTHYPTDGGDGAPGLLVSDALSLARSRDTTLQGGSGGAGGFDPCGNQALNGFSSPGFSGPPAGLALVPGSARKLLGPMLARESTVLSLSFLGQPGDSVYLLTSLGCKQQWAPTLGATLLVQGPFRRTLLGIVAGNGRLDVLMPVAALPVGVNEAQRNLQCVLYDLAGNSQGGTATTLTVLDQQF